VLDLRCRLLRWLVSWCHIFMHALDIGSVGKHADDRDVKLIARS
jgi:hypothetical protein